MSDEDEIHPATQWLRDQLKAEGVVSPYPWETKKARGIQQRAAARKRHFKQERERRAMARNRENGQ